MFFLMVDLTNSDRVKRELESGGYGVFAKTLSILMLMTLYLVMSIMVVVVHLVRESSSFKAKAPLRMPRIYRVASLPRGASTPVRERSGKYDGHLELGVDRELEFCGHWQDYSVASFPHTEGFVGVVTEGNEGKDGAVEVLKKKDEVVHNDEQMVNLPDVSIGSGFD